MVNAHSTSIDKLPTLADACNDHLEGDHAGDDMVVATAVLVCAMVLSVGRDWSPDSLEMQNSMACCPKNMKQQGPCRAKGRKRGNGCFPIKGRAACYLSCVHAP